MYFYVKICIVYAIADQHFLVLLVSFESLMNKEILCLNSLNSTHVMHFKAAKV